MKTSGIMLFLCSLPLLTCSSAKEPAVTLDPIYAIKLQQNEITFWVRSTGCTKKNNFEFSFEDLGNSYTIFLSRTQRDNCRRMPKLIALSFPITIKDDKPVTLKNPLRLWHS